MTSRSVPSEAELYPWVQGWMKTRFRCFHTAVNSGLAFSRIDVAGLRDIGDDLSGAVEVISVEVKRGTEPFATAVGQALGYRVYANRVFLAEFLDSGKEHSPQKVAIASHLGVGLIEIRRKGQKFACKEVLSSPVYAPLEALKLKLVDSLGYGLCMLCGCYFDVGGKSRNQTPESMPVAVRKGKGLRYYNFSIGERKRRTGVTGTTRQWGHEERFLCPDCVAAAAKWATQLGAK